MPAGHLDTARPVGGSVGAGTGAGVPIRLARRDPIRNADVAGVPGSAAALLTRCGLRLGSANSIMCIRIAGG